MVKFILSIDGIEKSITCADCWNEVSIENYIRLVNEDEGKIEIVCSILTGIPVEQIYKIPASEFVLLAKCCSFVYYRDKLIETIVTPSGFMDWHIGEQSWGKLEQAKKAIARCSPQPIIGTEFDEALKKEVQVITGYTEPLDTINAAKEITQIYYGQDISGKPITEVIGIVNFFLFKCLSFLNAMKI